MNVNATETRVRGKEVVREGYGDIMSGAGAMHVYMQTEYLKEWRVGLEEADPGHDGARAGVEIEVLYVKEVLCEHVDGVELCAARGH